MTLVVAACSPIEVPKPASNLNFIAVAPASRVNLLVGSGQQFDAIGTYLGGSEGVITSQVTWTSSNPSAATISAKGLATGKEPGNTIITAVTSDLTSPPVILTVVSEPKSFSISVTPASPSNFEIGSAQQFTATVTFSDGSSGHNAQVIWGSTDSTVATISSSGLAIGLAVGTTSITGSISGVTSPAVTLTVTTRTLSSIAVTPTFPSNLEAGSTQQFTATGTYSNNSIANITSEVSWASDPANVAALTSPGGLATGIAPGITNITASLSGFSSPPINLVVIPKPTLSSIAITPASPSNLAVGSTQQFTATGTYSNNSITDLTSQVKWESNNANAATIVSGGLATGAGDGTANITAALSTIISPTVTLTVMTPQVYASYLTANDITGDFGAIWKGQTFNPTITNTVTGISLRLYPQGTLSGLATVFIYATEGGVPTGSPLISSIIAASSIPASGLNWVNFNFASGPILQAGTTYAWVLSLPSGNSSNLLYSEVNTTGSYAGRMYETDDGGNSWILLNSGASDMLFNQYGVAH